MAYAIDPNQQNQQNQQQNVPGAPPPPVATSAAPGAGPAGSKTPTGVANQQTPAQPFTNLQSYLTANAPQIQQQANTISGNLQNQYGQVKSDVNAGTQAFNQQVAQGYTPENAAIVQQAAANPAQFVQTPSNTAAFQSQINDQYTGPANFEGTAGYGSLNKEVTRATKNADLLNTPAGIQTYLQGTEQNPTQGETILDSVLLQQSPQAIQQVQQAASPFSQLPQYLSNQVLASDQAAQAAPLAAQQAAANAAAAFTGAGGVVPAFQKTLAAEVPAAQAQQNAYNEIINKNAANLNPMNTALKSFEESSGVTGLENPLTAYLNQQAITTAPSLAATATPEQYAEDAALQQLLGSGYNPVLDQSNVGQAGTFQTPTAQAADPSALALQLAGIATQGTFSQKEVPNSQPYATYLEQLLSQPINQKALNSKNPPLWLQGDVNQLNRLKSNIGATGPLAQSQVLGNPQMPEVPNFYSNYRPTEYENLLQYLSSLNPTGITPTGNAWNAYTVNS